MTPRPETNVTPPTRCQSDMDCSLNGRCSHATGRCSCLAAWSGPRCGLLNLLPAVKGAGLHAPDGADANTSSWGGSVAYDAASGRWQMFAAEMVNHCGIGAWETNSRIVRASSPTPGGEYTVEEQIKPPFAHEPVLQRLHGGRWLLYSIGNSSSASAPRTDCVRGYSPRWCPGGFRPPSGSAVPDEIYVSDGPDLGSTAGWSRVPTNINPQLGRAGQHRDGGDINPAPLLSLTNDSVIMMWRGGDHWYDIHLAQASNWSAGPYKSQMKGSVLSNIDTRQHGVEDPYLYRQPWPDQTGGFSYHAIFHDHSTFGGHAFSEDGLRWTYRLRDIIVTIRTLD